MHNHLIDSQTLDRRDYSNHVLVTKSGSHYFLPIYLRVVLIGVEAINVQDLTASILCVIDVIIYTKNLPPFLEEELQEIEFAVKNQVSILRGKGPGRNCMMRKNKENNTMEYEYRGKFPLDVISDPLMAPFDVVDFKLTIMFFKKIVVFGDTEIIIKFNFMNVDDIESKVWLLEEELNSTGIYGYVENSMSAEFSYTRVNEETERRRKLIEQMGSSSLLYQETKLQAYRSDGGLIHNGRIKNWRYANYKFKLYRYPINTLVMTFVPMWILTVINLFTFWAFPYEVFGRLQTVSALLIAYTALIPTVKARIPTSSQVTMIQYLIYALSFIIFLSSLEVLLAALVYFREGTYTFDWRTNWIFIFSMTIGVLTVVIVLFLVAMHKLIWEPRYNFCSKKRFGEQFEDYTVDTAMWTNPQASIYFKESTSIATPQINRHLHGKLYNKKPQPKPRNQEMDYHHYQNNNLFNQNEITPKSITIVNSPFDIQHKIKYN